MQQEKQTSQIKLKLQNNQEVQLLSMLMQKLNLHKNLRLNSASIELPSNITPPSRESPDNPVVIQNSRHAWCYLI
ncbi:hypothetical protein SHDE107825_19255 [Shewanella denitrificans]